MSKTPRTDEVMRIEDNHGAYPGTDGMDGVTPQEAHDTCFAALCRLSRQLERELANVSEKYAYVVERFDALETQPEDGSVCPWAVVGSHMCREAFSERCEGRGSKKLRFPIGDARNKPEDDPYELELCRPQKHS